MKVQITVDEELWKKAKAHAAMEDQTLGELVGEALGNLVNAMSEHGGHKLTRSRQVGPGVIESVVVTPGPSKPVVVQSNVDGTCSLCKKTGVKTAMNKERKWVCYECAGVKS